MTVQEILTSLKKDPKTSEKIGKELKMKIMYVNELLRSMKTMKLVYNENDLWTLTDRGRRRIKK